MTDWSKLSDAYGSADGVPDLLDRFEADPPGVWSELMDRLCPQLDTAFSAGVAALPRLAGIAAAREPAERHWTLFAAGPIVSSARRSAEGVAALQLHATEIAELARLADDCLRLPLEPDDYLGLLGMALAFEGVEVWDTCLDNLAQGEFEVDCPYCGVDLFIVIGEDESFSCSDDYALGEVVRAPLRPMDPAEAAGPAARLHERALADGQPVVARRLSYLFGGASCTDCGTDFPVAERVIAQATLVVPPIPPAPAVHGT
ncbi:hypothetical protein [Kitasatospora paracochleata]|uniref:Uncharacterized protein n=1 Tax=Kitasatospora paracochleata TaxID=58354 RepID=A0ABT1JAM1_9ACTN|nr:hypothetical protein [Kitasatospora paracochleata]MCP2314490.1 hypothetical protein [Kitasatospora paracochleata]